MQFLNFLVGTTCFFLLLFSLHLFFAKKGVKRQNILLSILFFARFGQILTSLSMTAGQHKVLALLFQGFTPLYYAAPACFYLYITGFIYNREKLTKTEWLHFIPAAIAIIHIIPWPGNMALDWKLIATQLSENGYLSLRAKSGLFPAYFQYVLRPVLIISYLFLCWRAVIKSKFEERTDSDQPGRNWILFLLKVATFFQVAGLVPILLRSLNIPLYNSFFIVLNCAVLLAILLYALHRPQIFYGYLLVAINWEKKGDGLTSLAPFIDENTAINAVKIVESPKPLLATNKRVILSIQQISLYAVLMKDAMEQEQLYLQPDLQIIDLASKINIPIHHCSYVINSHIGKNFRDWINSYRVDHFLKQYPVQGDKITIEAIAQESGFKSQATFYNAFKKEKGLMPTSYFSQELPNNSI